MELPNFLKRGCDFYEKTDKRLTMEYVSDYIKTKFKINELKVNSLKFIRIIVNK
jgi:hypothetical protein